MKKRLLGLILLLVIVLTFSGCGSVVSQYDRLISVYQQAQKAAAKSRTTIMLGFNKIQNYLDIYNKYLQADVEKTKVYRESLADFGVKLSNQNAQYTDEKGNILNPSKIDLSKLVESKATPADMAITVNNYAVTLTEAPIQSLDVESLKETNRYVNEAYNEIMASLSDWYKAVEDYNTERTKASGDVVARVAKALGVRDLPESLTYGSPNVDEVVTLPKLN